MPALAPSVGRAKTRLQRAELIKERLGVIREIEAMSVAPLAPVDARDYYASTQKRRDTIARLAPGPSHADFRARFGFDIVMRVSQPETIALAAEGILAGMKAMPGSRAAQMLAPDEKSLRAIVHAIRADKSARKKARQSGSARTTERDVLNCALEMFYDDYAAGIGLVLEGDELARLQALALVPRRPERRAEGEGGQGNGGGSTSATGTSSASAQGSEAPSVSSGQSAGTAAATQLA